MKIAHISDLHFASPYFVREWADNVMAIINQERPDLLVVTGDLTDNGYANEFEMAKAFIDRLEARDKLVLPGNHDARNLGYEIFEELFGSRFPCFKSGEVSVVGLDSTEPDLDDGHIGREHYRAIADNFAGHRVRILALHHHLIPIPGTGRERQIPVDAGDVLGLCKEVSVDLVLSGHKHFPWIWNLNGTYFVTTGTATTRRLKGRSHPAMGLLDISGEGFVLQGVKTDTLEREVLLRAPLRNR